MRRDSTAARRAATHSPSTARLAADTLRAIREDQMIRATISASPFDTPLTLTGPLRAPKQMLAAQNYDGHDSIHDGATAAQLGFKGAPIEGPTHFSQLEPLLFSCWGQRLYEQGCISAHYKNMVVEGEEVRAALSGALGSTRVQISAEKKDATPVLEGSASLGPEHGETELSRRMAALGAPQKLVILRDVRVGDRGAEVERVRMGFGQHLGNMYPFTLADKLKKITELCAWSTPQGGRDSPWGRPIIPFEMVCVLAQYTSERSRFKLRTPHVGLFADLEIRMLKGPLFVDQDYFLEREIVALSESRRTESYWVRTRIRESDSGQPVAETLLNHAAMKDSFPDYARG
jgi:hypothetical protein